MSILKNFYIGKVKLPQVLIGILVNGSCKKDLAKLPTAKKLARRLAK